MSGYRFVTRAAVTLLLALPLSACLMDSRSGGNWSEDGVGSASAITLTIDSPTSAGSMDTTDASVSLGGTAASDAGISQVEWRSDRGGQGTAIGTTDWQTGNIALELGENTITVTAADTEGNAHERDFVVNRESGEKGSVTLSWVAPTARMDGTPLNDLAGYTIYYGRLSETYDYQVDVDNPGVLTYVVEELVSGEWYFAMSAYDSSGVESERSNEVTRQVM